MHAHQTVETDFMVDSSL